MEVTSASAVAQFTTFCDSIILTSDKKALLHTSVPTDTWTLLLSQTMRDCPYECALGIKWRPNSHGGRTWASPAATDLQLQAVRAQAAIRLQGRQPGSLPSDFDSTIALKGSLGPDPTGLLRAIMNALAPQFRFSFQEVVEGQELPLGGWRMLKMPGTDDPSGRIQIRLGNSADSKHLEDIAHSVPISIGGSLVALAVTNSKLQALPKCFSGNDGGAPATGQVAPCPL